MDRSAIADQIAKDILDMAEQDKCLVKDRIVTRVMAILWVMEIDVMPTSAPVRDPADLMDKYQERLNHQREIAIAIEKYRKEVLPQREPMGSIGVATTGPSINILDGTITMPFRGDPGAYAHTLSRPSLPVPAHPGANQVLAGPGWPV